MRAAWLLVPVLLVIATARRAEACSCAPSTEAESFARAAVVAVGLVEMDATRPGRGTFVVQEARKGAEPGARLDIRWMPRGQLSCSTDMTNGPWRLYLYAGKDGGGELSVGVCDAYAGWSRQGGTFEPAPTGDEEPPLPPRPQPGRPREVEPVPTAAERARAILASACRAANDAIYDAWPPERRGERQRFEFLRPKDLTLKLETPEGWRFRWARWPTSGVAWEVDVLVAKDGTATVKKAWLDRDE